MFKKIVFALSIIGVVTLQNCKPNDGDDVEDPLSITAPNVTLPDAIKNVDGVLAAIITSTFEQGVESKIGSAQAVFYKNKNSGSKVDGGNVTINGKKTIKSDANIYFYTVTATEPKGLEYGTNVYWITDGNTANDVPAFGDNDGLGFPNVPSVPESLLLFGNQDKLIDWISSTKADSVVFVLSGSAGTYKRVFPNTVTKHTILKTDIAKLGAGSATLTITNYTLRNAPFDGKTFAFLKQCVGICSKINIVQ